MSSIDGPSPDRRWNRFVDRFLPSAGTVEADELDGRMRMRVDATRRHVARRLRGFHRQRGQTQHFGVLWTKFTLSSLYIHIKHPQAIKFHRCMELLFGGTDLRF